MLDFCVVASRGGLTLWQADSETLLRPTITTDSKPSFSQRFSSICDRLVREVVIEGRPDGSKGHPAVIFDQSAVRWSIDSEQGWLLMIGYPKQLQLGYIDGLLEATSKAFSRRFSASFQSHVRDVNYVGSWPHKEFSGFSTEFIQLWKSMESVELAQVRKQQPVAAAAATPNSTITTTTTTTTNTTNTTTTTSTATAPSKPTEQQPKQQSSTNKGGKAGRKWNDKISKEDAAALDYSVASANDGQEPAAQHLIDREALEAISAQQNNDGYDVPEMANAIDSLSNQQGGDGEDQSNQSWFGRLSQSLTQKTVTQSALEPVLEAMEDHLVQKNVAKPVATTLCQSVRAELLDRQISTFTSLRSLVRDSLESSCRRILTPRTSTDLLREISTVRRQQQRPYVISFIGVNGVGKSTNLSKVCFWLLQNNHRILIAACDTFRSGAVEQLRTHVRNLRSLRPESTPPPLELFERGYGKDAATIAKEAITYGKNQGFDIILIDTAGRMQDNEPLMRSLAKLVTLNQPDKILFVGEALVGNEAVDQLSKFNQALRDFSGQSNPRQIDGIILTKFDTIDDKVGAALSMTFTTGKPILFVGTGQTYTDLRKLNIRHVVDTLLK